MNFTLKISALLASMRPKQWTKNGFVFAGLIFSKSFFYPDAVIKSLYAFMLFSLVSGAVYIINDVIDRKKDALHPVKCKRPLASGKIMPPEALMFSALLLAVSLMAALALDAQLFFILTSYFVLVTMYSLWLKNLVIVDVILISAGFVLRTVGGTVAIHVRISPWLIVCTTLLALFLALSKRRSELVLLSTEDAAGHRKNLEDYSLDLIDRMLGVVTSTTVMSYSLYTFNAGKSYYMMFTIPFVLYGIFRYQYLALNRDMGGSPELVLLKDRPLLVNILLWIISSIVIVALYY